jgi:hypothetical protein
MERRTSLLPHDGHTNPAGSFSPFWSPLDADAAKSEWPIPSIVAVFQFVYVVISELNL